ncbi:unknown [Clostridium sp. CAG:448]|nr:unknown [Clostridium sp. CAG:448]
MFFLKNPSVLKGGWILSQTEDQLCSTKKKTAKHCRKNCFNIRPTPTAVPHFGHGTANWNGRNYCDRSAFCIKWGSAAFTCTSDTAWKHRICLRNLWIWSYRVPRKPSGKGCLHGYTTRTVGHPVSQAGLLHAMRVSDSSFCAFRHDRSRRMKSKMTMIRSLCAACLADMRSRWIHTDSLSAIP